MNEAVHKSNGLKIHKNAQFQILMWFREYNRGRCMLGRDLCTSERFAKTLLRDSRQESALAKAPQACRISYLQ